MAGLVNHDRIDVPGRLTGFTSFHRGIMGKKRQHPVQPAPQQPAKGSNRLLIGAVIVIVIGGGVLALWRGSGETAPAAAAASPTPQAVPAAPQASPVAVARAEALAKLGPRKQANLPPIPFQGYSPPRSMEVITAAYQFAAEHPEILSYVPCFCGCERAGHGGNHDCFVKARAENGDVIAWDPHGVDCAVCIDVANRSRQMFASGATVQDIRAAIDAEYGKVAPTQMATPHPPAHSH
jgi:hypothetical protein